MEHNENIDDIQLSSLPNDTLSPSNTPSTTNLDNQPILPNFDKYTSTEWQVISCTTATSSSSPWLDNLQSYITLTLVGLCIGSVAALLNILTEYFSGIKSGYCSTNVFLNESYCPEDEWSTYPLSIHGYLIFIALSLILSSVACWSVLKFGPLAAGSGISEVKCIISGFRFDSFLEWRVFIMKALGLPLAIASGLSLGKEGPSVHYAVCVGSLVSLFVSKLKGVKEGEFGLKYRNVLISSSAAGVAVAFGSPMGGVLFSIEEISNSFNLGTMWESYYCSLVAVTALQFWNPFNNGKIVMFEVRYDKDWSLYEIPLFMILGAFGGVYGVIVSKFNVKAVNFRKKYLSGNPRREIFVLTLITVVIAYWNTFLKLDMTESMQLLFEECTKESNHTTTLCQVSSPFTVTFNIISLLLATVIRMVFTIFTYGAKVPAGIFVPSMACGATFGRALGIIAQVIQTHVNEDCSIATSCVNPGIYAFLGAASALSGITHLTVAVVIIMFELTGALKYVIPTMISVAVTKIICDKFGSGYGGIADLMIHVNGLPFISAHTHLHFQEKELADAMVSKDLVFLPYGDKIGLDLIKSILNNTKYSSFPVLNAENDTIKGIISREVLEHVVSSTSPQTDTIDVTSHLNTAPVRLPPATPLTVTYQTFLKLNPNVILVQSHDGKLQGLITKKDIQRYEYLLNKVYYDEEASEQKWEHEDKYNFVLLKIEDTVGGYVRRLWRRNTGDNLSYNRVNSGDDRI